MPLHWDCPKVSAIRHPPGFSPRQLSSYCRAWHGATRHIPLGTPYAVRVGIGTVLTLAGPWSRADAPNSQAILAKPRYGGRCALGILGCSLTSERALVPSLYPCLEVWDLIADCRAVAVSCTNDGRRIKREQPVLD